MRMDSSAMTSEGFIFPRLALAPMRVRKIKLLIFLRGFPDDLFGRYLCKDLLYQAFPYFTGVPVKTYRTCLAGFRTM